MVFFSMEFIASFLSVQTKESLKIVSIFNFFPQSSYLYIIHGKTKVNSISQSVFPKGLVKKDVKVNLS